MVQISFHGMQWIYWQNNWTVCQLECVESVRRGSKSPFKGFEIFTDLNKAINLNVSPAGVLLILILC